MADQFWLTRAQLARIAPFFPLPHGVPRVDDRRVVSGIIHVIRNGLRWRDAPADYGPHKTRPTTASCAGAALASSTASSQGSPAKRASPTG